MIARQALLGLIHHNVVVRLRAIDVMYTGELLDVFEYHAQGGVIATHAKIGPADCAVLVDIDEIAAVEDKGTA